jgi:16S rRNA processing protein RimM
VDKDNFLIGRLGAPKGVRGDLKLQSYSGESEHFRKLKEAVLVGPDPATGQVRRLKLKIERLQANGGDITIAFAGYPSPETARALTGLEIVVPRAEAAPLGANEWYVADLVGLSLVHGGVKVATVRSVIEGGAEPWLEAQRDTQRNAEGQNGGSSGGAREGSTRTAKRNAEGQNGGSSGGAREGSTRTAKRNAEGVSLVPFRKEFVGEIDLEAGTIELLEPRLLDE